MPAESSTRAELNCPKCGYSLKGQEPAGSVLTCPECGRMTSIRFILEDHRRRSRGRKEMGITLGIAAAVCALAMILAYRARLGETSFHFSDEIGLVGFGVFLVALLMSVRWISAPWRLRLLFAAGLCGLIMLFLAVRGPLSYLSFAATVIWITGYHVHAIRRGYY